MTVPISSDRLSFVRDLVTSGDFQSEEAVVNAAIDLLRLRTQHEANLRSQLQPALDRLAAGEGLELDDEGLDRFFDDLLAEKD